MWDGKCCVLCVLCGIRDKGSGIWGVGRWVLVVSCWLLGLGFCELITGRAVIG